MNNLLITFVIALGINLLMFIPAYRLKTDKFTDISYSITFVIVAIFGLSRTPLSIPKVILFGMILIWAFRLGSYLLMRIRKIGKDNRFDEMRGSIVKFGSFWVLQGLTVFIILIPSTFFFDSNLNQLSILSYLGILIWLLGLIIESIADYQKTTFINNPENKGKWVNIGLWKHSRHPNYLGEIFVWIGIYLYILPALNLTQSLIGLLSPIFIITLLLFVSGIPLLEKSAEKKWGSNASYQLYKRNTGLLFPKNTLALLLSIALAQLAGMIGAFFTVSSVDSWYLTLVKPDWNPPSWVFGPVWTALYFLMGIAAFLVWRNRAKLYTKTALIFYGIQLILNALWSILFFGMKNPALAFAEILVLLTMIVLTTIYFRKVNKASAYLMLPYIAWVAFAAVLNFTIWQLN